MALSRKNALTLIFLFGIISLLGDIIYEGARSVNGQYLNTLGVSAFVVGFVMGMGEFFGYFIRLFSGYIADRIGSYWFFVILGYGLLMSVPLLSISDFWAIAALLIILERIGKGLRSPAKDTLVSHGTKNIGTGLGFGILEFVDQIGAVIGPLVFTFLFISLQTPQKTTADYQRGYGLFWIPFLMLILILLFTFFRFKKLDKLQRLKANNSSPNIPKYFWIFLSFTFINTLGFVNFALIGYHLRSNQILPEGYIPFLYSVAMTVDAIFGIILGRLYDSLKLRNRHIYILLALPIITAITVSLGFSKTVVLTFPAICLWGGIMGAHETVMKAVVSDITSLSNRGTSFGIFHTIYGFATFLGGVIAGFLYDISVELMVGILILIELLAIPMFFALKSALKF
ncbi:MAG: MFS transporter [Geminocystis sp.]|nr:MFS transporter [Geminocystis sp.]HIK38215.1 MFS transporter [Geminocystis sp. M7585_C2015_104]MCS7148647.1 MFS transporter [Geminocystis sp.]MCX8079555.1 MFS transporter [Geminocystis sp.]MDW8115061.1 MFS transporter [Geminocystis sp.]